MSIYALISHRLIIHDHIKTPCNSLIFRCHFDFYEVNGDMTNWLAKNNIPAISVLLSTHENIEWSKNKAGIEALLKHYDK